MDATRPPASDDPVNQRLILLLDDILDWTDRDLGSRVHEERERAARARAAVAAAIEVIAADDVPGALRTLTEDQ